MMHLHIPVYLASLVEVLKPVNGACHDARNLLLCQTPAAIPEQLLHSLSPTLKKRTRHPSDSTRFQILRVPANHPPLQIPTIRNQG